MKRPELIAGALEVAASGERLWLLPQLAAYWPRLATLLIADAHLGKAAAFRHAGVPVPSGTTAANLERLTHLVSALDVSRIVFLGDLVHNAAAQNAAAAAFKRWRGQHADLEVILVRGNHDRHAGNFGCDWNIDCVEEPHVIENVALVHVPRAVPGCYALGGHVHPSAHLVGRAREYVRLPCFHFTRDYAVLPAFGAFTGMADIAPASSDTVYVVADGLVLSVQPTYL